MPVETSNEQPQSELGKNKPLLNFLLGVFFGLIPVGVGLDMSSFMTHTPVLEYEAWKLVLAAGIPVAAGVLGAVLKGKFLDALGDVLSSTTI